MSAAIGDLIPELQPFAHALVDAAGAAGLQPRVTSTLRTHTQQARLYREFLRGGRGYPVAPPGTSAHEYGYAFDMVLSPMDSLRDAADLWLSWGGVWTPGDAIHFQYPGFVVPATDTSLAPTAITSLKDFLATSIPGPVGGVLTGLTIGNYFSKSEAIDLLTHPSQAVSRYPWLRALGAPFIFF